MRRAAAGAGQGLGTRSARADLRRIADGLAERGWSVCPAFIEEPTLKGLRAELLEMKAAGALERAGVGRASGRALRPDRRSDVIVWLEEGKASSAQRLALDRFEALRLTLNRELALGLFDFECHFALYPPGALYQRHRDRFADDQRRTVSCVLYLNEVWQSDDGGTLRLHLGDRALDVQPVGGTLATFLSERIEHEVLPARRERLSLAGWFRRRSSAGALFLHT